VSHAAGCHTPEPMTDPAGQLRCPACKYVQPKPQASTQPTGYVCRDHHDQPVTWRGTGCQQCAAERKRPKATVPSDDYEMETYQ